MKTKKERQLSVYERRVKRVWEHFAPMRRWLQEEPTIQAWLAAAEARERREVREAKGRELMIFDHGWHHVLRTTRTLLGLLIDMQVNRRLMNQGFYAGMLHDIGAGESKYQHAERGAIMARKLLEDRGYLRSDADIADVVEAIANHGDGGERPNVLTALLTVADKADMCRQRPWHKESPLREIESYRVRLDYGVLRLCYWLRSPKGRASFFLIPKGIDVPLKIGRQMSWKVEFYINGEREYFPDRKFYTGPVYDSSMNAPHGAA